MLQTLEEVIQDPSILSEDNCFIDKLELLYNLGLLHLNGVDYSQESHGNDREGDTTNNYLAELDLIRPAICRATKTNIVDFNEEYSYGHRPYCENEINEGKLYGWIFRISGSNTQWINSLDVAQSNSNGRLPKPLFSGKLSLKPHVTGDESVRGIRFNCYANPTKSLRYSSCSKEYRRSEAIGYGVYSDDAFQDLELSEYSLDGKDNWLTQRQLNMLSRFHSERYFQRYIIGLEAAVCQEVRRGLTRIGSDQTTFDTGNGHNHPYKIKSIEIYWEFLSSNPLKAVHRLRSVISQMSNEQAQSDYYTLSSPPNGFSLYRETNDENSLSLSLKLGNSHTGSPRLKIYAKTNKRIRVEVSFSLHNESLGNEEDLIVSLGRWRERALEHVSSLFFIANQMQGEQEHPILSASVMELINSVNFVCGNIQDSNLLLSILAENGHIALQTKGRRGKFLSELVSRLTAPSSGRNQQPVQRIAGGEEAIPIPVLQRRRDEMGGVTNIYIPTPHFQQAVQALAEPGY